MRIANKILQFDIPYSPGFEILFNSGLVRGTGDSEQKAYIYNYDLFGNKAG